MIYQVELDDGRIVEVEAEPGQEKQAALAAKRYVAQEAAGKFINEDSFDYETGIKNASLRAQLDTAETILEKETVLQGFVGSDGFIRDANGKLAITPKGQRRLDLVPSKKNIIIDEEGFSFYDFADFAGTVGPIAGAIAALSPQGRALKVLTPILKNRRLVNVAATALGSAGGKGVEEAAELIKGTQEQDAAEIAGELAVEGLIGGVSQGIFEVGGAAFHAMLGRKAPIVDVDIARAIASGADPAELQALNKSLGRYATFDDIKKAQADGTIKTYTPAAVSQRALGREIPGRLQAAAETVFGRKERDNKLIQYGSERLTALLNSTNDISLSIDDFGSKVTTGRVTKADVDDYLDGLRIDGAKRQRELEELIANEVKLINENALLGSPDRQATAISLRNRIQSAYDNLFGQGGDDAIQGEMVKRSRIIDDYLEKNGLDAVNSDILLEVDSIKNVINNIKVKKPFLDLLTQVEGASSGTIARIEKIMQSFDDKGGVSIESLNDLRGTILVLERNAPVGMEQVGHALRQIKRDVENTFDKLADGKLIAHAAKYVKKPGRKTEKPGVQFSKGFERKFKIDSASLTDKDALESVITRSGEETVQDAITNAAKMIKEYNTKYKEARRPFNNLLVSKIRKDTSTGAVDVDLIYKEVIKRDRPEILRAVLEAIPDNFTDVGKTGKLIYGTSGGREIARKELQENFIREAVHNSLDEFDQINPVTFAKFFETQLGSTRKELFKDFTDLDRVLSDFARIKRPLKSDKLEVALDRVKSDGLRNTLDDLINAENAIHVAEKDRLLRRITSAEPDEIVDILFRDGQGEAIRRLRDGNIITPDAFQKIQADSMRELLRVAKGPGQKVDEVFNPDALERALNSRGDDTLRAMFSDEQVKSLRNLVRDLRVMTQSDKGGAGTLIAGAIAVNAFQFATLPVLAKLGVMGMIMRQPSIVRRMAKTDKESISIVGKAFKDAIRLSPFVLTGQQVADTSQAITSAVGDIAEDAFENVDIDYEALDPRDSIRQIRTDFGNVRPDVGLDIPDVQPIASATAPISRSLLGGSPANEDIAARQFARQQPNIDEEISRLMRLS